MLLNLNQIKNYLFIHYSVRIKNQGLQGLIETYNLNENPKGTPYKVTKERLDKFLQEELNVTCQKEGYNIAIKRVRGSKSYKKVYRKALRKNEGGRRGKGGPGRPPKKE